MKFPSKIIQDSVEAFSALPGIGKKSALRIVLHLATKSPSINKAFSNVLLQLADQLKTCKQCFSYSDDELCDICRAPNRDQSLVCVVESIRDLMAIEETHQFKGVYHVLTGLISPIDGIGPDKLTISSLIDRLNKNTISELIMAIRPSIEGDTTVYYITKNIDPSKVKISMIARGIAFGSELEYADEFTLGRSIMERTPYSLNSNGA